MAANPLTFYGLRKSRQLALLCFKYTDSQRHLLCYKFTKTFSNAANVNDGTDVCLLSRTPFCSLLVFLCTYVT